MSRINTREERRKKRNKFKIAIVTIITFLVVVIIANVVNYQNNHFKNNTIINGINCSNLTVEQAQNKIKNESVKQNVKLIFYYGNKENAIHTVSLSQFEPIIRDDLAEKLTEVLKLQPLIPRSNWQDSVYLESLLSYNQEKVKKTLLEFPEVTRDAEDIPKALIEYDENSAKYKVNIDINQVKVDIDLATSFVVSNLEKGINAIDFYDLANQKLAEATQRFEKTIEPVNNALATTIVYRVNGVDFFSVDANVIKEWIYKDESGNYKIDLDGKFNNLIMELQEKTKSFEFEATGIGKILVDYQKNVVPEIDQEQELKWLKENFGDGEYHVRNVSFIKEPVNINYKKYIELDITRQKIWMYIQGECILESSCVTGNLLNKYDTPTGIYYLTYKTTDAVLKGYNSDGSRYASPVKYWMPFNGGIGFHDASWRKGVFGGEIYKTNGSHGCVNMPLEAAKTLYENISSDIPIIIYKS